MGRVRHLFAAIIFLFSFTQSGEAAEPVVFPSEKPKCKPDLRFSVIDFSFPIHDLRVGNESALKILTRDFKIDTVFRYYDHENETIPGKTLTSREAAAILSAKMSIGVVFQHNNADPTKFMVPDIGSIDADRALFLADKLRQPFESAIYFGIDGPERESHLEPLKQEYKINKGSPMSRERKTQLREEKRNERREEIRNKLLGAGKTEIHVKQYLARADVTKSIDGVADRRFNKALAIYDNYLKYGPAALGTRELDKITSENMIPVIARYFSEIRNKFDDYREKHGGNGFKIGLYCTPLACIRGDDQKWADFIWLSPEGRLDAEYKQMVARRSRWHFSQQRESQLCTSWRDPSEPGREISFDFNQLNPHVKRDIGQWNTQR